MLSWKFYLKDLLDPAAVYVEVDEPIGWDKVSFTLQRSDNYIGLENIYTDSLEFYGAGFDILRNAYDDLYGFEGQFEFKIEAYCEGILDGTKKTAIMLSTYSRLENGVTVKVEYSGFDRTFKNRLSTPVDLSKSLGIDGLPLSECEKVSILAHSKEIILSSESTPDVQVFNPNTYPSGYKVALTTAVGDYESPPYEAFTAKLFVIDSGSGCQDADVSFFTQIDLSNIISNDDSLGESLGLPWGTVSDEPNPFYKSTVTGKLRLDVSLNLASYIRAEDDSTNILGITAKKCGCSDSDAMGANSYLGTPNFTYYLYLRVGDNISQIPIVAYSGACGDIYYGDLYGRNGEYVDLAALTYNDDTVRYKLITGSAEFDVVNGDNIYVLLQCVASQDYEKRLAQTRVFLYSGTWLKAEGSSVSIQSITTEIPSPVKGYYLYEAFNRISESITGELDCFRSEYFGRDSSTPTAYDSDGCAGWTMLTNGLNIRQMKRKDLTEFPVVASFEELFNACNSVWNLGMRIETDDTGKKFIRVEPKEYFFKNTISKYYTDVAEITTVPALELIFNEFEIGYDKWNIGTGNLNFIDEFNTKRNYSIPIKNVKNKLDASCKYIAGGYAIELTRRVQYSSNPTSDFETDNDNFFICLNRNTVISDLYTTPKVSTSYPKGKVSERNENYLSIDNYFSPNTVYNIAISTADNAMRWYNYISPSSIKRGLTILFQSGDGNYQEEHELANGCKISEGVVVQDQDLLDDIFSGSSKNPLYIPNYKIFTVPMSLSDFNEIEERSNESIFVSCGGESHQGSIKELAYYPNIEGGYAEIKILESFCRQGGFDNGFDNGFEIGSC